LTSRRGKRYDGVATLPGDLPTRGQVPVKRALRIPVEKIRSSLNTLD
jgi:hypothetical protein